LRSPSAPLEPVPLCDPMAQARRWPPRLCRNQERLNWPVQPLAKVAVP
jgi:hypothetical protein